MKEDTCLWKKDAVLPVEKNMYFAYGLAYNIIEIEILLSTERATYLIACSMEILREKKIFCLWREVY